MTAVNHFYDEDLTVRTHTGDTDYTFVAGMAQISGGSLSANTTYLIIAHALFTGNDLTDVFGCRVSTADAATIATKSESILEPLSTTHLFSYFFVHSFDTDGTPADVEFQIKTFDSGNTVTIDQMGLTLIDLDDLGASNYYETVHADDASEYPTAQAAEFTIAGANLGTDEWAVLAYQRTQIGSGGTSRDYRVEAWSAVDSATTAVRAIDQVEGEDTAELRMSGFAVRHKASSGTPNFEIQTWEEAGQANDLNAGGYAIALKADAFESGGFQWDYEAGSTTLDTTERTFATISSYSPTTTADHLFFAALTHDPSSTAGIELHIEDDAAEMRTGDQPVRLNKTYDATSFPNYCLFHQDNILSSDTSTYTSRATTPTTAESATHRWLIILSLELAGGAGSASPAVIARSFTVDATTQVGGGVDVQDVIARSFTVDAPAAKGAAVDVQDVIARSFAVNAPTQLVGPGVQVAPGIDRSFALDQVTPVAPATDVQDLIARSFTVGAATAKGAGVDVQDLIARSFALDQVVPVGAAVDVQDLIARLFALDPVTTSNTDAGAGTASPAVIARAFTVDGVTPVGSAVDVQDLIARAFTVDAATAKGAGVDVQSVIARSFTVDAVTLIGQAVQTVPLIARAFTVDAVTLAGLGEQVAPLIARSFGLGAVTVAGAGVDVQDLIARAFTVDAVTLVGGGVQTAPLIALVFALDPVTTSNTDPILGARITVVAVVGRSRASAISRRRIKVTDRNRVT